MADMKPYLYSAVLLCLVMGSQSETTDYYKSILGPLLDDCRKFITVTQEEYDSVLEMTQDFSPAAKCLLACAMTQLEEFDENGELVSAEQFLAVYERVYADRPERLENARDVVTTCHDEVTEEESDDVCEIAALMVGCTRRLTYGEE